MDPRQRPIEEGGKGYRVMEAPIDRSPRPGDDDEPVARGDPELGADVLAIGGLWGRHVEARRPADADFVRSVHALLDEQAALPVTEHIRPAGQAQLVRTIPVDVPVVRAGDHPVLDGHRRDALESRRGEPVLAVVLIGQQQDPWPHAPDEPSDPADRLQVASMGGPHLIGHPAGHGGAEVHARCDQRGRVPGDRIGDGLGLRTNGDRIVGDRGGPDGVGGQHSLGPGGCEVFPRGGIAESRPDLDLDRLQRGPAQAFHDGSEIGVHEPWPGRCLHPLPGMRQDHEQATGIPGQAVDSAQHEAATADRLARTQGRADASSESPEQAGSPRRHPL